MIRAIAFVLALLITPATALSTPLPDIDRTSLGPIIVRMNDQAVWPGCLQWRADILTFMTTALKNAGFKTVQETPNTNHAILKVNVSAGHDPVTDTCKGNFNALLSRTIWIQDGVASDTPLLLDVGGVLGPDKTIDTDLVNGLRKLVNHLKAAIAE